jgi:hypothetical protein
MRTLLFFIFLCLSGASFSQSRIAAILKDKEVLTDYYEMSSAGSKVMYLPMEFGKSTFSYQQAEAIGKLQNATIVCVDVVYSDYPAKADFTPLTKKRLETLEKLLPELLRDPEIEFRKVRQTIAKTKDVAESLEHGFFIYFRPNPVKGSGAAEARKLKSLLKSSAEKEMLSTDTAAIDTGGLGKFWCWQILITTDTSTLSMVSYPVPEGATRTIKRIHKKQAADQGYINLKHYEMFDSVYQVEDRADNDCMSSDGSYFIYDLPDSTVSEVFRRHKWKGAVIVADVTGSMYPYTGQLLKWLQLNLVKNEKQQFLFFNDGDMKDDREKVIGKTGGLYPVLTKDYDEVEKTIIKAMTNGGGGDAPENNIEALLEVNRLCASCDSIVMIADNWAPVKDISLLSSLKKPVKVVLCGVLGRIHKDYLRLARDTKGSVHLIEEDIYNLAELKEGETITIHGILYKLVKGEFVVIKERVL